MSIRACLAGLLALTLIGCGETEPMSEHEFRAIVNSVVLDHNTPIPRVSFEEGEIRFQETSLAETHCDPSGRSCSIIVQRCALSNRSIEELAVHEAAHVINAYQNQRFDHGREWSSIMHQEGYNRANPQLHNRKC